MFGNENINTDDPFMDRSGQMIHYPNHQENNASVFPYSYYSNYDQFMWQSAQESSFVVDHEVLANEEALKWNNFNQTSTLCLKDTNGYGENMKIMGKKGKKEKETSMVWIKGQWTDDEDRFIILFFEYSFFLFKCICNIIEL